MCVVEEMKELCRIYITDKLPYSGHMKYCNYLLGTFCTFVHFQLCFARTHVNLQHHMALQHKWVWLLPMLMALFVPTGSGLR